MKDWISVNKRLPKAYTSVLVFTESEVMAVAILFRKKNKTRKVNKFVSMIGGVGKECIFEDVTHWAILPKEPTKQK